jgi:hypothetical protein
VQASSIGPMMTDKSRKILNLVKSKAAFQSLDSSHPNGTSTGGLKRGVQGAFTQMSRTLQNAFFFFGH